VRQEAQQRGRPVSQKKLDLCAWSIVVTNAPATLLGVAQAWVVRRVRWQKELVFKLFKSEGPIDETRSRCPWRVLCELYAKLLGLVVQQWVLLAAGYETLKPSAWRAARRVRQRALRWLAGLEHPPTLEREVERLARVLHRHGRVARRKKTPSTRDRLLALDPDFERHEKAA
jgi:Transposase DDE domain